MFLNIRISLTTREKTSDKLILQLDHIDLNFYITCSLLPNSKNMNVTYAKINLHLSLYLDSFL